ncbi:MAG: hypothetical protein M1834_002756 [Cirrosporium novae-zelandiae]|nr:MAG: hypothetical protein M1834_002756 [Cirrosporium novae-zelandiae]
MGFFKKESQADRHVVASVAIQDDKIGHWWHDRGLLKLNLLLFIPLMSEYVQGYDASLINNVQQLHRWQNDFNHPTGNILGLLSASYWVGNVAGVVFISFLSDGLGRRQAMFIGSMICIIGTALATAAINVAMFIVGRFMLGIGGVLVGAVGPVLMAELAYPSQRATATALSNTQYSTGAIIAAWITFGSFRMSSSWAWRIPTIFQALPSVLQAVGIFFLPESPRWLVARSHEEKALSILAKYHGNGDRTDIVVQTEYREILSTIELEISAKQTRWSELWRTPGNRWRSFILIWCGICKQWSGNGLVSYYLSSMLTSSGITSELHQTLITATSQMFSFLCSIAFAFLPGRVGRRPLLLTSMALMWLVFSIITATTGTYVETSSTSASYASVAFIYLYSGVHNLGWTGAMMVYVVEILPYSIRAKGIALFWLLTGAAGAFNTYVNPLGIDAFGWKFYFFYVAWIAIQFAVVYVFFIETKGPTLEEVAILFDGEDAKVAGMAVKEVGGETTTTTKGRIEEKKGGEGVVEQIERTRSTV